jgi:serine/threonine-protein kinase HipA
MKRHAQREISVHADWHGLGAPVLLGTLTATVIRGKEVLAFEYDRAWLEGAYRMELDPNLGLYGGPQYARDAHGSFGIFLDSSPDRWGRLLMDRREARDARLEQRAPRKLMPSDYLLGVNDLHRTGALRFKLAPGGPFLDDRADLAAPPMASLRELEAAAMALDADHDAPASEQDKWISMLIAPGGSLGGARPKASIHDEQGRLWIAKFPSTRDQRDVGAWEMVLHRLARSAGIEVAESRIQHFGSERHTFITQRFDRMPDGGRIHFASAMTQLGRNDGDDATTGASYLEFVAFLRQRGSRTAADLAQLWRRIVFFVCVSNTDDHLRNHGFLLDPGAGWRLAPAFDMNPVPEGDGLRLNIDEHDNAQELALVRSVSEVFGIGKAERDRVIDDVVAAVRRWRAVAAELGIPRQEQDRMAPAFRVADLTATG